MQRPTSRADRAAWWLIGVLGLGVVDRLITDWIGSTDGLWVYAPSAVAVLFVIITMPGGVLSRERRGASPLGRLIASVFLLAYLGLAPVLAADGPVVPTILGISLLAIASTSLTWNALRTRLSIDDVALGVALLLLGVAGLLLGVATLLLGVALLLLGVAVLLDRDTLAGVAFLLLGVAGLLAGVAFLLAGAAVLLDKATLAGVAVLLLGVALLLAGVAPLPRGSGCGSG